MPVLDLIAAEKIAPRALAVIEAAPSPGLGAAPKCRATRQAIESLVADQTSICESNGNCENEKLALSALWLLAGELDRSHSLSQAVEATSGSYWHGIMHRREGDFWNSKYWFRRVGAHPVLQQLAERIAVDRKSLESQGLDCRGLVGADTVAEALVDLCQAAVTEKSEISLDLELICWWEWQLLFSYSLG